MRFLALACLIFSTGFCGLAQNGSSTYKAGLQHLDKVIRLVKAGNASALAGLVRYPLKMQNPVPDIKTKQEFIANYRMLFDEAFKKTLAGTRFNQSNTIDRTDGFGILDGDLWLDESGKIIAINHISPDQRLLIDRLTKEALAKMHAGIAPWKTNILVCETPKLLLRVDLMPNDSLRYISWSKPRTTADEPDLVLLNGVEEFQGTMGGVTYTFKNKEWTYVVDRVLMAETAAGEGLFLRVNKGDTEVASYRCKETK